MLARANSEGCQSQTGVAGEQVGVEEMETVSVEKFVSQGKQRNEGGGGGHAAVRVSVLVFLWGQFCRLMRSM